jgi:hypothetical protein
MFQFKKCLLLAALAVASLSAVSTAGATSVTVGPTSPTNITGTSGVTLLAFHNASKTWSCTSSSTTGTAASNASGLLVSSNVKLDFSGCSFVGGLGLTIACSSTANISATAATAAGNTPGAITSISCHIFVTSSTSCRVMVNGSMGMTFNDPAAGLGARITTDVDHQSLTATSSTCTLLPNDGSVRFSASTPGTSSVYTLTPTNLTVSATP